MNRNGESEVFLRLLKDLTALPGVSGFEQPVVRALVEGLTPLADRVWTDRLGNVYALRRGCGKSEAKAKAKVEAPALPLMLVAHSDQVGCIVSEVLSGGLLRFRTVGRVAASVLPSTRVLVGPVEGVVTAPTAHVQSEVPELFIDIGARSAAEAAEWGVRIGTPVSFRGELQRLGCGQRVCGTAIDDRVGCAILLTVLKDLYAGAPEGRPAGDVYAVFSVHEETNMGGARVAGGQVADVAAAITVDTVPAMDVPAAGGGFRLGAGPVVQLIEGEQSAYVGTIAHPGVVGAIEDAAAAEGVPLQYSAEVNRWTTDAAVLHTAGTGIPTGLLSIPRRYAHSPAEVLDIGDALAAVRVLTRLAADFRSDLEFLSFHPWGEKQ